MERVSVLDRKASHVLSFPLTIRQQLWLIFLLPALFQLAIYVSDVATDIAVALQLLSERKYLYAAATVALVYLPAFMTYVTRLCNPPDTKEMKVALAWISIETAAFVLFPIRPIQCIAERLFWSIEALRLEDPEREEALLEYEKTMCCLIENYFFTQSFLQAAPQALLQATLLLSDGHRHQETGNYLQNHYWILIAQAYLTIYGCLWLVMPQQLDTRLRIHYIVQSNYPKRTAYLTKEILQLVCILCSLASVAQATSSYERYESQVLAGRSRVLGSDDRALQISELLPNSEELEGEARCMKAIDEDNPVGKFCSFIFWYLFLFGRLLSLVLAAKFYPWLVLTVSVVHYTIFLIYLFFSTRSRAPLVLHIFLSAVYVFSIVEIIVRLKKVKLFYVIFFSVTIAENIFLTVWWSVNARWSGSRYSYCIYLIAISHILGVLFLLLYLKWFKPKVRLIRC